jgi:hypothetical protein
MLPCAQPMKHAARMTRYYNCYKKYHAVHLYLLLKMIPLPSVYGDQPHVAGVSHSQGSARPAYMHQLPSLLPAPLVLPTDCQARILHTKPSVCHVSNKRTMRTAAATGVLTSRRLAAAAAPAALCWPCPVQT